MKQASSLTLKEAGYVLGQSSTAINRAVDRGLIKAKRRRHGKAWLRQVGPAELRFLAISGVVEKDLTPAARRKIYQAVLRLPADAHRVDLGVMEFKLTAIDQLIAERLARLERVKSMVDDSKEGGPVLRGTTVPVHTVAALARGQPVSEIIEDHPGIDADQVDAAVEYAKVYPKTGRPLPTRSLKRVLSDMAASGIWDAENDPEPVAPQPIP